MLWLFASISRKANLQLNNAATRGDRDGLRAAACAELLNDVLHVSFYRLFGDGELACNVSIAISASGLPQNINLTIRQSFITEAFRHFGSDLRRHTFLASVNLPNDICYLSRRHIFKNRRRITAQSACRRKAGRPAALRCFSGFARLAV